MRIVFVHGINQEGKSEAALRTAWLKAMAAGTGGAEIPESQVSAPFYGDRLAELTSATHGGAVAQGADGHADMDEMGFLASALTEQAQAAGIGNRAIAAEQRAQDQGVAVQQGFPMDRRLNAIVRIFEKLSPLHGDLVLHLLKQAYAYLKKPNARDAVDAIVRPAMDQAPAIIVTHSLGTVVSFKILRQLALEKRPATVPLFVTLGSPLTLMTVQAALGPAFSVPEGVHRWVNAVDPDDFIALGRGLDVETFSAGIDNILDIKNIPGNAHAIEGYLGDKRVAEPIVAAFRS